MNLLEMSIEEVVTAIIENDTNVLDDSDSESDDEDSPREKEFGDADRVLHEYVDRFFEHFAKVVQKGQVGSDASDEGMNLLECSVEKIVDLIINFDREGWKREKEVAKERTNEFAKALLEELKEKNSNSEEALKELENIAVELGIDFGSHKEIEQQEDERKVTVLKEDEKKETSQAGLETASQTFLNVQRKLPQHCDTMSSVNKVFRSFAESEHFKSKLGLKTYLTENMAGDIRAKGVPEKFYNTLNKERIPVISRYYRFEGFKILSHEGGMKKRLSMKFTSQDYIKMFRVLFLGGFTLLFQNGGTCSYHQMRLLEKEAVEDVFTYLKKHKEFTKYYSTLSHENGISLKIIADFGDVKMEYIWTIEHHVFILPDSNDGLWITKLWKEFFENKWEYSIERLLLDSNVQSFKVKRNGVFGESAEVYYPMNVDADNVPSDIAFVFFEKEIQQKDYSLIKVPFAFSELLPLEDNSFAMKFVQGDFSKNDLLLLITLNNPFLSKVISDYISPIVESAKKARSRQHTREVLKKFKKLSKYYDTKEFNRSVVIPILSSGMSGLKKKSFFKNLKSLLMETDFFADFKSYLCMNYPATTFGKSCLDNEIMKSAALNVSESNKWTNFSLFYRGVGLITKKNRPEIVKEVLERVKSETNKELQRSPPHLRGSIPTTIYGSEGSSGTPILYVGEKYTHLTAGIMIVLNKGDYMNHVATFQNVEIAEMYFHMLESQGKNLEKVFGWNPVIKESVSAFHEYFKKVKKFKKGWRPPVY